MPRLFDDYRFDRFLRYAELVAWIEQLAAAHPDLVTMETYGRSFGEHGARAAARRRGCTGHSMTAAS